MAAKISTKIYFREKNIYCSLVILLFFFWFFRIKTENLKQCPLTQIASK